MRACAAERWTPCVGAACYRKRSRRREARVTYRLPSVVRSARSDDSRDPEPNAGDVSSGSDPGLVVDACKKTGAWSSGGARCFTPDTTTTALALVPPETALSPLMSKLNARTRRFAYPALGGMTLEMRQAWSEDDVGTGAAVWDASAALADDLARDGCAVALRRFRDMAGASCDAGARGRRSSNGSFVTPAGDARPWWRGAVVVELGAGLGVASLVAASLGARALATDGDESVCSMCARNARDNAGAVVQAAARAASSALGDETRGDARAPACRRLLWGDARDALAAKAWIRAQRRERSGDGDGDGDGKEDDTPEHPDAILLADVVYGENDATWRALARTLRALAGPETAVILSHARRGDGAAMETFRASAERAGFSLEAAETKSESVNGFVAVIVTYALRLMDPDERRFASRGEA